MIRKFLAAVAVILFVMSSTASAVEPGDVIRATGEGKPPSNMEDALDSFAKTFARQAARMNALRKLVEQLDGAVIDSKIEIVEMKVISDRIESQTLHDSKTFELLTNHARQVGDARFKIDNKWKLYCEVDMEVVIPDDWK